MTDRSSRPGRIRARLRAGKSGRRDTSSPLAKVLGAPALGRATRSPDTALLPARWACPLEVRAANTADVGELERAIKWDERPSRRLARLVNSFGLRVWGAGGAGMQGRPAQARHGRSSSASAATEMMFRKWRRPSRLKHGAPRRCQSNSSGVRAHSRALAPVWTRFRWRAAGTSSLGRPRAAAQPARLGVVGREALEAAAWRATSNANLHSFGASRSDWFLLTARGLGGRPVGRAAKIVGGRLNLIADEAPLNQSHCRPHFGPATASNDRRASGGARRLLGASK